MLECGTGKISINQICKNCHSSCKQCSAENDQFNCTACYIGNVLLTGECISGGCPAGMFIATGGICQNCLTSTCETCFGPLATNCLTCNGADILKTDTSECVGSCPSNYYTVSGKCYPCDTGCATCDGPSSTNCLTCPISELLQVDGSCSPSCAIGTFQ